MNNPVVDPNPSEPEKTPEPSNPNDEATLDDPPPQDHETFAEQMEIDPTGHADNPPSPSKG